ncbi:cysteine rich repeat-containing protein [Roseibium sp. RKSG952]|uniref:cysteine rich repeat-containing protein n=1 Tax=Roseibium sp. RKSG952 TaxID=2529384 RepID=UPI0012BC852D|nr:hypothetical protein [Roseibium sp. RKSG952]
MCRLQGMASVFGVLSVSFLLVSTDGSRASSLMTACKVDVETLCKGVEEGRGRVSACLFAHGNQISGACKPELAKVTSSSMFKKMLPESLSSIQASDKKVALQKVCGSDIRSQCSGVSAGLDRVLACLYARSASISKSCYAEARAVIEGN